jgi:hypothetical protein
MSTLPVNATGHSAAKTPISADNARPASTSPTQTVTPTSAAGNLSSLTSATAPGLPLAPPVDANKLPTLAPPKTMNFSDASLTAFIGSLTNEYGQLELKNAAQNIDMNAKQIKAENEVQAAKMKEQQQALQDSKNKSWFAKVWGYVSKAAMLVAGVALAIGSGGAATPLAAYMIYTSAAGLIKSIGQDTGLYNADFLPSSIGDAVGKILVVSGVDKDTANAIGGWVDVAVAVAAVGVMGFAMFAKKAADTGASVISQTISKITNSSSSALVNAGATLVGAGAQVGQSVTGLQAANATAVAQTAQAETQTSRAILERAQALLDQESELVKTMQQSTQDLFSFVMDYVNVKAADSRVINQTMA